MLGAHLQRRRVNLIMLSMPDIQDSKTWLCNKSNSYTRLSVQKILTKQIHGQVFI